MSKIGTTFSLPGSQPRAIDLARALLAGAKVRGQAAPAAPGKQAPADTADLSAPYEAWPNAASAHAELAKAGALLDNLRSGIDSLGTHAKRGGGTLAATQATLDELTGSVGRIATGNGPDNPFGYRVENVNHAIHSLGLFDVGVGPGEVRDVEIEVTLSAQQAALWLQFGEDQLNLGAGSAFILEIAGIEGAQRLAFSSGTTLTQVADAFNSFSRALGVVARASANGVRLESLAPGQSDFVSVRIINDGAVEGWGSGVYAMQADNANAVSWGSRRSFDSVEARAGILDRGQNLEARIDDQPVTAYGARVLSVASSFTANFALKMGPAGPGEISAQTLGKALAFTIIGEGGDNPGGGGKPSLPAEFAAASGQSAPAAQLHALPPPHDPLRDAMSLAESLRAVLISAPSKAQPTHRAASALPWLTPRPK